MPVIVLTVVPSWKGSVNSDADELPFFALAVVTIDGSSPWCSTVEFPGGGLMVFIFTVETSALFPVGGWAALSVTFDAEIIRVSSVTLAPDVAVMFSAKTTVWPAEETPVLPVAFTVPFPTT